MGCAGSKEGDVRHEGVGVAFKPPRWKPEQEFTPEQVVTMRAEFWDTAPAYGGSKEIWDAIKAVCEAVLAGDTETAQVLLDAAGIIVAAKDMTCMYDERGAKYDLPPFVLTNPE